MRFFRTMHFLLVGLLAISTPALGAAGAGDGLKPGAYAQMIVSGTAKYLGQYAPAAALPVGDGWTQHEFDPDGGNGPICIAGTPYSVFTRAADPSKLLILEQGGGACWQDFYNCNIVVQNNPLPPFPLVDQAGIWNRLNPGNPFADYSVVYLPYCDGSVFSGDNDVVDANFPFGPIRFHRGLRNQSAAIDLAKALFPNAARITLAGSSAGGVGVAVFTPFLARMAYGNAVDLTVINDAGPVAVNLDPSQANAIAARADDWRFGQFYPSSCADCDELSHWTDLIDWRLKNDRTIREAVFETDGDLTNRFFLGLLTDQPAWRNLIVTEHGELNTAYPNRYKRFFKAGDTTHTALQTLRFYTTESGGIALNEWVAALLVDEMDWVDIVEPSP